MVPHHLLWNLKILLQQAQELSWVVGHWRSNKTCATCALDPPWKRSDGWASRDGVNPKCSRLPCTRYDRWSQWPEGELTGVWMKQMFKRGWRGVFVVRWTHSELIEHYLPSEVRGSECVFKKKKCTRTQVAHSNFINPLLRGVISQPHPMMSSTQTAQGCTNSRGGRTDTRWSKTLIRRRATKG